MDQGLGAGGVEECKGFSPPTNSVPKTNAASPRVRVPLVSLVFNTPTPTPSRQTFAEDLRSAEATRSADTVKTARFAQRTEEQRLHKARQRRTEGSLFLQHLDFTAAAAAEELRSRRQQHAISAAAAEATVQARREERTRPAGVYTLRTRQLVGTLLLCTLYDSA